MSGRVLRFRVWDNGARRYVATPFIDGHPLFNLDLRFELNYLDDSWDGQEHAGYTFEQWTGLNDAKGQPIYEGDVLSDAWDGTDPAVLVAWANAYSGPQWCVLNESGKVDDFYGGLQADCRTVLGNRHEHPHLLSPAQLAAANPSQPPQ